MKGDLFDDLPLRGTHDCRQPVPGGKPDSTGAMDMHVAIMHVPADNDGRGAGTTAPPSECRCIDCKRFTLFEVQALAGFGSCQKFAAYEYRSSTYPRLCPYFEAANEQVVGERVEQRRALYESLK